MEYRFEIGQRVRLINTGETGEILSRVPGNGSGAGWYSVLIDGTFNESETIYADELDSI